MGFLAASLPGDITPGLSGMASIIADITSLVTAAVSWISSYVTVITGNPLLLIFVIVAFVGLGVGLIKRLIKL